MAGAAHLVKRFFGSLWPGGPPAAEEDWARSMLLEPEHDLWVHMKGADRRHAIGVAHRVQDALGPDAERPVVAAALLHDVGKTVSGLGVYGRVVATLSAKLAGHDMAAAWTETRGFTRRVGQYLEHPRLGGDLLGIAGSDPLTEAWTREHHSPADSWTLPPHLADALKAADDD